MADSSPQRTYARSLIHCMDHYGYPLLSPNPSPPLDSYQNEGLKIGDIGFVDRDGVFHVRGNIQCDSSSKINQTGLLPSNFQPVSLERGLGLDITTSKEETSLVKSEHITEDLSGGPSAPRTFYSSRSPGAILILPSGVVFDCLNDLDRFSEVASQYGHRWCKKAKCRSVYLITGLYRTRSWSRAYFTHHPGKIVATRQDGKSPTEVYGWTAEHGNVYNNGHTEKSRVNQTIFTRGFRITRKDVPERDTCFSKLWALITDCLRYNKLVDVRHEPTFVQPFDIPDEIGRRLLKKFPRAKIAIVHDDAWTSTLNKGGLSWDDPVQIEHFIENVLQSPIIESDQAVLLRSITPHPLTSHDIRLSTGKQIVIQSLRAENILSGLSRMPFGFYIQVDNTGSKTKTKRPGIDDTTVEWMEVIPLPHSFDKVRLSVCAAFGFDQTLSGREVLYTQEVEMVDLINPTCYLLEFSSAVSESLRPSLFLTLGERLARFWSSSDHGSDLFCQELSPRFEEETLLGHEALVHYYRHYKKEDIMKAVSHFGLALNKVSENDRYYATALFNLTTAQLNTCITDGMCADFYTPLISHFQDVFEMLPDHHPDRPAVLLQLSRALLRRYEKRGDENSPEADIETWMKCVEQLCAQGSHESQAMDLILQTYRRCKLEHTPHNLDDILLKELDKAVQFCPEGYFDRPHRLINLGIALRIRSQRLQNSGDINKSIMVHEEALRLIPHRHPDTPAYLINLSTALMTRFDQGGDPSDLKKLIEVITRAEGLLSIGHVDRPACLHTLGVALLRRFELHADLVDLDRSVTLTDEAVQLIPAKHTSKMSYLYYLGFALLRRFDRREDFVDLNNSADIIKQMHELPRAQPDRVNYLDMLRNDFLRRSEWRSDTDNPSDMKHVIAMLRAPLDSASFVPLLGQWAQMTLASGSWKDALAVADSFMVPIYTTYRVICEHLEMIGHITDAGECFCQMMTEMGRKMNIHDGSEEAEWMLDFRDRLTMKLEDLGDIAMSAEHSKEAVLYYSAALSLNQNSPQRLLVKRIKAFMARNLWDNALNDAGKRQLIKLDPSSPLGYEMKYLSLRSAIRYEEAVEVFEMMLSVMSRSSDPEICERSYQYVNPKMTRAAIRTAVEEAIRGSPRVLINTTTGRLCDQPRQTAAFESSLMFADLIFSKATHIDDARIKHEVMEYYRYAMFSHKWEKSEPTFRQVIDISVYDLEEFPTHHKLQMFCKVTREAGFHWAWSDVCCINRENHHVLQEALVSMFGWYQRASMTVVFLLDTHSPSRRGDLLGSTWNTRVWTLQEFCASKVVRFYNEDWTTYLNLDIPNHKESPEILSEMEERTGFSAQTLLALQPGLENIREKLRLTSLRRVTRVEDMAYALFGIFSVSLPIKYGEGNRALGRLLAQLISSSGDASILAWTGRSGDFNSCLPADIVVFDQLPTTHIPPSIDDLEMDAITARLRTSSLHFPLVMKMYDDLLALPAPSFTGRRLKLPCISFPLGPISTFQKGSERVFHAVPAVLGTVEIQTKDDISRLDSLVLIHPWIDFLLDRRGADLLETTEDEELQALQVLARLRQSFGALLLEPIPQRVAVYRRVASESMIKVQVGEITPMVLKDLIYMVCMLEVE